MAFKFSTGLRTEQIFNGSLRSVLHDCYINIYAGPVPASPDDALAEENTLLCIIKEDERTISFEGSSGVPVLTKNLSKIWQGDVLESGIATFFRLEKSDDNGERGVDKIRIQGTVGGPSADLTISNPAMATGTPQRIEYFSISLLEA